MARRLIPAVLTLSTAALLAAGCGATPPQAPLAEAKKLDASLSDISTACGEIYQMSAFGPAPSRELIPIEHSASSQARKLLTVYARNPAWIYQGQTVRLSVAQATSTLRQCGLRGSAAILAAGTRHR